MAVINRTLDASEQKESIKVNTSLVVTGSEIVIGPMERACTLTDIKVAAVGVSGTPTFAFKGLRFIAGTGGSSFAIGTSFSPTGYGTSGYVSFSLPAVGSSQLALQKGDAIVLTTGAANAAVAGLAVDVIVQNIQDIKTWY